MANIYELYETDHDLEVNGVWFETNPGVRFLIARAGAANRKYQQAMQKRMKPYRRQLDAGTLSFEVLENVANQVFVEVCLLDWEGVAGRDGELLEFNRGNALKVFSELPDLARILREEAQEIANYRVAELKEDKETLGN